MLNKLLNSVLEIIVAKNQKYHLKMEKLMSLWEEKNDGIPPNMDKYGRLHAPCNGYTLPIHLDYDGDYDVVYAKGSYLPIPLHEMSLPRKANKHDLRVKMPYDLYMSIRNEILNNDKYNFPLGGLLSNGSTWEQKNIVWCYVYIDGNNAPEKEIQELLFQYVEDNKPKKEIKYKGESIDGKHTVKGKVLSIKSDSYSLGYSDVATLKMLLVLDNDSTCYGTLPKALYDAEVGDEVEFTATFKKSDDHHSFYSRPSKSKLVSKNV